MPKGIPKNGINKGWFKKGENPTEQQLKNLKLGRYKGKNKGNTAWNKGKENCFSPETILKMSKAKKNKIGTNNNAWKGNDVSYSGLHYWIKKYLSQPTKCEHCKKDGLTGRKIGWANKDHKYKRNLVDWIRLCASCHKIYDRDILKIKVGR